METSELSKQAPIVLLTDFGNSDFFVGALKGVCASLSPGVPVIDITHDIPPGDIRHAAITLWQAIPYFPVGSVFCCVVDPGVGTSRRGMIAQSGGLTFVGPDNGVFSFVLGKVFQAWELLNPDLRLQNIGSTFHGRDIFAPAAAYVVKGIPGSQFGPPIDPQRIPEPRLILSVAGSIEGEILFDDHFGNVLTSIGCFQHLVEDRFKLVPWLKEQPVLENSEFKLGSHILQLSNGVELPWVNTFAEITWTDQAYLVGSSGLLEVVANRQSAKELTGLKSGDVIKLNFKGVLHG
jgi:S-adenosylmethionine hydrolase